MADNCNLAENRAKLQPEAAETGATPGGSARKALSDCALDAMKQGDGSGGSSDGAFDPSAGALLPPVEITQAATGGDIVRGTLNVAKDVAVGAVNEIIDNPLGVAKTAAIGFIGGAAAVLVGPELALAAAAGYGVGLLGRKLYDDGSERTMDEISSSLKNLAHDFSVEFAPQKYDLAEREKAQAHIEGFGAQALHMGVAAGSAIKAASITSVRAGSGGAAAKKSAESLSTAAPDAPPGTPVPPADVPPPPQPHTGGATSQGQTMIEHTGMKNGSPYSVIEEPDHFAPPPSPQPLASGAHSHRPPEIEHTGIKNGSRFDVLSEPNHFAP